MQGETTVPDPRRQLTLNQILGHDVIRAYLMRCIAQDQLPQSILFSGPAGVGKRTLAWALVREIIAEGGDPASHRGSLKAARGTHPDICFCEAKSAAGQIVIDDIRDLDEWTSRYPVESQYKFGVIAPADKMNPNSANALLKLLEEPPKHLVLILITADPSLLLPTIRSRCTPLPLEAVPLAELVPWLIGKSGVGRERVELAAELAEGRPGYALSLLQSGGLEQRGKIIGELRTLKEHGFATVFGVAERLGSMGDPGRTLKTMVLLLRDALSVSLGMDRILNRDLAEDLRALGEGLSPGAVLEAAALAETAAGEAADYYAAAARAHFLEVLVTRMGRELRRA